MKGTEILGLFTFLISRSGSFNNDSDVQVTVLYECKFASVAAPGNRNSSTILMYRSETGVAIPV